MPETLSRMLKVLKQLEYEYELIRKTDNDSAEFTYKYAIKSFKESIYWYKEFIQLKGSK